MGLDVGTISIIVVLALIILLAIGMPLGFASAALAVLVMILRFEPSLIFQPWTFGDGMLSGRPGVGPFNLLQAKIFQTLTSYVLISVPLFIFMAALLERSGVAKQMYDSLAMWLDRTRGGIAIVTSIMAVIMAAMSGIIGGEVVLLGLIALPQMLRLGYNQNLAIGTICASGSLGTMIPPSIVLIFYGLISETSIKSLFTAAFVPGFMLASFIILYIIIRTQLRPQDAPLPNDPKSFDEYEIGMGAKILCGVILAYFLFALASSIIGFFGGTGAGREVFFDLLIFLAGAALFAMSFGAKGQVFLAFLTVTFAGFGAFIALIVGLIELSTLNSELQDDPDALSFQTKFFVPLIGSILLTAVSIFVFGKKKTVDGWLLGKGLVAPFAVIFVVMGSIYGGVTGITEAAGMGALAVFLVAVLLYYTTDEWITLIKAHKRNILIWGGVVLAIAILAPILLFPNFRLHGELRFVFITVVILALILQIEEMRDLLWDSLQRTLKSTGTIIWVTIGAAALSGAYTVAGGPNYIANLIVGADLPTMGIILTMMVILLFMGAFMDWVGIVLLIIPVFLPIIRKLPLDEIGYFGQLEPKHVGIWFGVVFCMNMQVSFLSPPFGPAAFYLKSVAPPHISLTDIFKGFLPFIGVQLLALSVLLIWPPIVAVLL